jgi:hypothetical protein
MVVLTRAIVAERYYCTLEQDVIIHIGCYSGNLSNINECGAAALVKSKYPGFYEKVTAVEEDLSDDTITDEPLINEESNDDEQTI